LVARRRHRAGPCRSQFPSDKSTFPRLAWADEKPQLLKRLPVPLIRHLLHSYRSGQICARAAALELRLARSRFYELYADYLRACATGHADNAMLSRREVSRQRKLH
jgi:hypothetical protein